MGTWGAGNFDSDGALDYLAEVTSGFEAKIEQCLADEDISALDEDGEAVIVPSAAILSVLCERCDASPPQPDVVARWKRQYLALFDDQIDGLAPGPGYKEERRQVIEETFTKREAQSAEYRQDERQGDRLLSEPENRI